MFVPGRFLRPIYGAQLLALSVSCGSNQEETPEGLGQVSTPACSGDETEGSVCVSQVTGRVVDELGGPVPDLDVTVCGPNCFRGTTSDNGSFAIDVNHFLLISDYSVQAHGSPHATTFYHHLPSTGLEGPLDVGVLRVLSLPSDGDVLVTKLDLNGSEAPPQTVASGGVTLSVEAKTVVRLAVGDALLGREGARFRAAELETGQIEEFSPELLGARVFALGPFEADFSSDEADGPEVSLLVENRENWPPGSEVEVFSLGTYLDPEWLTPSQFERIGTAMISSDGETIDFPSSAQSPGLRYLTWIAFRLRDTN
jgi:hypothetical protein